MKCVLQLNPATGSMRGATLSTNAIELMIIIEALKDFASERSNAVDKHLAELMLKDLLNREIADTPQTEEFKNFDREDLILLIECQKERIGELLADKDTPQTEEIGDCNICRFAGCSECDDCINGSEWVRMVDYLEDVDDEQTDCPWK